MIFVSYVKRHSYLIYLFLFYNLAKHYEECLLTIEIEVLFFLFRHSYFSFALCLDSF